MSTGRNPILIGQAEVIDLVRPEIRKMLEVPGIYLAADTEKPGYTVPLVVLDGNVYSLQVDSGLAPERFKPTVRITGPFYAPGEEQEAGGASEG